MSTCKTCGNELPADMTKECSTCFPPIDLTQSHLIDFQSNFSDEIFAATEAEAPTDGLSAVKSVIRSHDPEMPAAGQLKIPPDDPNLHRGPISVGAYRVAAGGSFCPRYDDVRIGPLTIPAQMLVPGKILIITLSGYVKEGVPCTSYQVVETF
jgi:hypothetical protein